jgi:hypothetical protein
MIPISDALRYAGESPVFWLALAMVLVIATVGYIATVRAPKGGSTSAGEAGRVVHDWTPTGRIDFVGPSMDATAAETPAPFYLQAEDIRLLLSFSGIERKEIRWRKATLNEAKRVMNIFHRQMAKDSDRPTEGNSQAFTRHQDRAEGPGNRDPATAGPSVQPLSP